MSRRRFPPYVFDTALALALTVPTVGGLVFDSEQVAQPWWLVAPLAALTSLPLAVRRYRPLGVFAIVVGGTVALNLIDVDTLPPGLVVAAYTVSAHCERRVALRAGVLGLALLVPALIVSAEFRPESTVPDLIACAAAWILGDNLRTRRAYLRELEQKATRLERERTENERRAAADEQARIARELHDVIAHNVSVMVLQATGGREVLGSDPARAREALTAIESTGREALAELRRLLGVGSAADGAIAPQPGLPHVPALVEQVRAAGVSVELVVEGDQDGLPAGVELSAYRVIQEALTNTLRHAFAKHAWVFVRRHEHELEVEVADDGAGPQATLTGDGRGLIGMRERIALFGGSLEVGPRAGGGFRLRARFPT